MPRIDNRFLDAVVYLYPSQDDARDGREAGGTGFIAAVETPPGADRGQLYVVTNSHVVREGQSPIVRVNFAAGRSDIIPLELDQWEHHPDGDDVAAAAIGLLEEHRFASVPLSMFLTQELMAQHNLGLGDECFFAGRLVGRDGIEANFPTLRFGSLARLPVEPVRHPRGFGQESFLVEARSLSGYSGSPVFVYQSAVITAEDTRYRAWDNSPVYLLGVDWSHLGIHRPVLEADKRTRSPGTHWVELNAGMMGVVPAWKVAELLTGQYT